MELAEVLRQHGASYRAKQADRLLPSQQRALADIEQCRTASLGGQLYQCPDCEESLYSYHSCKNRPCPKCQHEAAQQWLEGQQALLLPVPYPSAALRTSFMVTFTLPEPLRALAYRHQRQVYNLLFRASAAALQELAADPRFVGGQLGCLGVLQTWTRDLRYHPHVHYLVPGGGLSADGQRWLRARNAFLVHVKPLARLFRAKFRAGLRKTDLFNQVPAEVWQAEWVVHCQPVGSGQAALKYLAPYIFRVAISNKRILKLAEGQVTFSYKDSERGKQRQCTLPAEEFIRRFLQHVLPKGLVKVRYYGLFSASHRLRLQQARQLLAVEPPATDTHPASETVVPPQEPRLACPRCGQPLRWVEKLLPQRARPP